MITKHTGNWTLHHAGIYDDGVLEAWGYDNKDLALPEIMARMMKHTFISLVFLGKAMAVLS